MKFNTKDEINLLVSLVMKMPTEYSKIKGNKVDNEKILDLAASVLSYANYENVDEEMRLRGILCKIQRAFIEAMDAELKKTKIKTPYDYAYVHLTEHNKDDNEARYLKMLGSILKAYHDQGGTFQLVGPYRNAIEIMISEPAFVPVAKTAAKPAAKPMAVSPKQLINPTKQISSQQHPHDLARITDEAELITTQINTDYKLFHDTQEQIAALAQAASKISQARQAVPENMFDELDDILEKLDAIQIVAPQIAKPEEDLSKLMKEILAFDLSIEPAAAPVAEDATVSQPISTPVNHALTDQQKHAFLSEVAEITGAKEITYGEGSTQKKLPVEKIEAYWKDKAKIGLPTGIKKIREILQTNLSDDEKCEHILAVVISRLNTKLSFFETRDVATADFYKQIKMVLGNKDPATALSKFTGNNDSYAETKKKNIIIFSNGGDNETPHGPGDH